MARRFSVEAVFKGVDRVTAPVSRMQQRLQRFTRSLRHGMRNANQMLVKVTRQAGALAAKLGAVAAGAGALGAAFVVGNNRASVEVDRLARSVGSQAATVEGLAGALSGAGFQADNVVDLMEEMNNKLGESAGLEELTPVTEALGILNLRFKDLKSLSPEQQFRAIADAALQMEDAQKAAAAADILMGGEANKIIGVLRQQGTSMDEILSRFAALNVRTDESRQGANAFVDALNESVFVIKMLAQEFSGLLGGYVSPLLAEFNNWAAANRELLRQRVAEWVDKLVTGVRDFWENLETTVKWLKRIGVLIAVVYGLAAAMNVLTVAVTAVNLAMRLSPIGWIITGVFALVAAIALLALKWDEVKLAATRFAVSVVGAMAEAKARIFDGWGKAIDAFKSAWSGVGDFFADLWDGIVDNIRQKLAWITGQIERVQRIAVKVGRFLGIGDESDEDLERRARAADSGESLVSSPQERTARSIEERRSTADLTIRDETGRAEFRQRGESPGIGFSVVPTGSFSQ